MKSIALLLFVSVAAIGCDQPQPKADAAPEVEEPSTQKPDAPEVIKPAPRAEVKITPLEHGSLLLESGGLVIAIDPVQSALDAHAGDEPKADLIIVTHIHGDHLDPAAIAKLRKPGAPVLVPQSVVDKAKDALPEPTVMANGDIKKVLSDMVEVEAVEMYNLKRKRPDNGEFFHPKGVGNGYVITLGGKRIYVSGDTECTPEMKNLKSIDIAFVCMNLPYTMTPDEAAVCINAFKPKTLYPYHYRGQDPATLSTLVDQTHTKISQLDWYPNQETSKK